MQTTGEFIDRLLEQGEPHLAIWLEETEKDLGPEVWTITRDYPFSKEGVLYVTEWVTYQIRNRLTRICTDALYKSTSDEGRLALQAIYDLASAEGLEILPHEIHQPLSLVEAVEARGLVTIKDGKVFLTAEGEAAAQAIADEIEGSG